MSIDAYVGLPGSGKSYGVVENVIIPALRSGRIIVTNIPLRLDAVGADYDVELVYICTNEQFKEGAEDFWLSVPGGAVIIIDEVWRIWPAGMKASDIPQYQKEFLAEHRHKTNSKGESQQIILVTQDLSQIANYVRVLVDATYVALKLDKVSLNTKYRIDVYHGPQRGPKYPKDSVSSFIGTYKPDIYKYYKSHTKSEGIMVGMERRVDGRATVWSNPFVRYGVPIGAVLLMFGLFNAVKFFSPSSSSSLSKPVASVPPVTAPPPPPPPAPAPARAYVPPSAPAPAAPPAPLSESKTWRVIGYSGVNGHIQVVSIQSAISRRVRHVGMDKCKFLQNDIVCELGGEIVAGWTGVPRSLDVSPVSEVGKATAAMASSGQPAQYQSFDNANARPSSVKD